MTKSNSKSPETFEKPVITPSYVDWFTIIPKGSKPRKLSIWQSVIKILRSEGIGHDEADNLELELNEIEDRLIAEYIQDKDHTNITLWYAPQRHQPDSLPRDSNEFPDDVEPDENGHFMVLSESPEDFQGYLKSQDTKIRRLAEQNKSNDENFDHMARNLILSNELVGYLMSNLNSEREKALRNFPLATIIYNALKAQLKRYRLNKAENKYASPYTDVVKISSDRVYKPKSQQKSLLTIYRFGTTSLTNWRALPEIEKYGLFKSASTQPAKSKNSSRKIILALLEMALSESSKTSELRAKITSQNALSVHISSQLSSTTFDKFLKDCGVTTSDVAEIIEKRKNVPTSK